PRLGLGRRPAPVVRRPPGGAALVVARPDVGGHERAVAGRLGPGAARPSRRRSARRDRRRPAVPSTAGRPPPASDRNPPPAPGARAPTGRRVPGRAATVARRVPRW